MNSNIIFWTSNKLERVYLLMIELEHLNFGFEWTDIKPKRPLLEIYYIIHRTVSFFWTANGLEYVQLLVIKLERPFLA